MRLYIMRHGIAIDRLDPTCPPDAERPLTHEGTERTRQALHGLVGLGIAIDRILTSPYVRSMQTAELAAEALGVPRAQIEQTTTLLPASEPASFEALLPQLRVKAALCIGHSPDLDLLIGHLCGLDRAFTSLKKAGVAQLEWKQGERARLVALLEPKILRQLGRP